MREQQGGTIVNVSSMAGRVGFPLFPVYSSTKFALEGVSESLRLEIDPLGIKIEPHRPGTIKSNFASNAIVGKKGAIQGRHTHHRSRHCKNLRLDLSIRYSGRRSSESNIECSHNR